MQHKNTAKAKIVFEILASIIREERITQNKSQRLLADEFDIQKSMLSRLENGINEPKLISLLTVSEALGVKLSEIIARLEERLPDNFSLIED